MVRKNNPKQQQQRGRGPNRFRKTELARAIRAANDSDVSVKAINISKDGGFTLVIGKSDDGTDINATSKGLKELL